MTSKFRGIGGCETEVGIRWLILGVFSARGEELETR
jgi:hypothetical protein